MCIHTTHVLQNVIAAGRSATLQRCEAAIGSGLMRVSVATAALHLPLKTLSRLLLGPGVSVCTHAVFEPEVGTRMLPLSSFSPLLCTALQITDGASIDHGQNSVVITGDAVERRIRVALELPSRLQQLALLMLSLHFLKGRLQRTCMP